jgi:hypothetical protein
MINVTRILSQIDPREQLGFLRADVGEFKGGGFYN